MVSVTYKFDIVNNTNLIGVVKENVHLLSKINLENVLEKLPKLYTCLIDISYLKGALMTHE